MAGWPTVVTYRQPLPTRMGENGMSLGVHTSSEDEGRCTKDAAEADAGEAIAVAAEENLWGAAGVLDGLITRWWSGIAGRGCGCGDDERSDKHGDQRCKEHHCA